MLYALGCFAAGVRRWPWWCTLVAILAESAVIELQGLATDPFARRQFQTFIVFTLVFYSIGRLVGSIRARHTVP